MSKQLSLPILRFFVQSNNVDDASFDSDDVVDAVIFSYISHFLHGEQVINNFLMILVFLNHEHMNFRRIRRCVFAYSAR